MAIPDGSPEENPNLSPAQRKRLKALAPQVERVLDADKTFFERFPSRKYRVRLMSPAELEQATIIYETDFSIDPGWRWFAAIRKFHYGRMRIFVVNRADMAGDTDLPEEVAKFVFDNYSSEPIKNFVRTCEQKEKEEGLT